MSQIKISELFYSIQGEGKFQGVPSVFLRTFGCNFECNGFGMPKGEESNERNLIASDIAKYRDYKDLPLVNTGCDSYASWDPRFKKLSPKVSINEIAKKILNLLPFNEWQDEHLVITGGEPLLGWQREYPLLLDLAEMSSLKDLTFETNGTQELHEEFRDYLMWWNSKRGGNAITFSVSPKLSVSGERRDQAIKPKIICDYEIVGETYLKFVVATQEDVQEALEVIQLYRREGFTGHVYLMPVGGVESVYSMNNRRVAELAMKHGLRYSDRLQVPLFKNQWGT